jgi:PilZ domain
MAIARISANHPSLPTRHGKKGDGMSGPEADDGPFNHRRYARGDVHIVAQIREKGYGHHQAKLADLSRSGCRVITPMYLKPDSTFFITIPTFAPLEARIAWHVRDEYGCEFVTQLHEAIYDHILKTSPAALRRD